MTDDEARQLVENARLATSDATFDPVPLIRIKVADSDASWLVTEIDPDDHDLAYGLADAGIGLPEQGHFRLSTLADATGALGGRAERDRSFKPAPGMTLAVLARIAHTAGRIVV
ncbi:DUF2958 domain-containing protein [Sphingomonas sp.]|uniref:DUF2958 domain-containing protein n=1 Tax=Sphingomonas sp. TaxID=28214 RepID=UPI0039C9687A